MNTLPNALSATFFRESAAVICKWSQMTMGSPVPLGVPSQAEFREPAKHAQTP
jgi:hypothetical protein